MQHLVLDIGISTCSCTCNYNNYNFLIAGPLTLAMWKLNLDDNVIVLNFSTLSLLNPANNGVSTDCTAVLIGPVSGNISMAVRLPPSVTGVQVNATIAICDLGMDFRYLLEINPQLSNNFNTSFLYYEPAGATGGNGGTPGNLLTDSNNMAYRNLAGTQAAEIILDNDPPRLMNFELLDLNRGMFVLSFNQPVNVTTFNFAEVSFQNSPVSEATSKSVILTNGSCSDGCGIGRHLTIVLAPADLDNLKLEEDVCISISTCYLHHTREFVEDFGGNQITASSLSINYLLQNLTLDTSSPILDGCDLNLSLDQLTLSFDEPIDIKTFNPTSISVNSAEVIASTSLIRETLISLSSASVITTPSGSTITINLDIDVDELKKFMSYALFHTGEFIIHVYLHPTAIKDIAGNNVTTFDVMPSCSYTNDTHPPNILSYILDLNTNLLQLTFSEPVHPVNPSSFTLTDAENVTMVNLNDSVFDGFFPTRRFSITFGSESLVALKTNDNIATSTSNTFLLISDNSDSVIDIFNNRYITVGPIPVAAVIPDNSPATAIGFSLDMNIGQIVLTFSDVVDVSTLRPSEIFIQNATYSLNTMYELSGSTNIGNSNIVAINFTKSNLIGLKEYILRGVAADMNTTYLTIRAHAINDIRGVDIIAVTDGNAIQANNYINDKEPPLLDMFDLDLDCGEITIVFNEPVQQRSINFEFFGIQANPAVNSSVSTVYLSNDGRYDFSDSENSRVFRYKLSNDVLSLLNSDPQLACSDNSTNLVIMQDGVVDASENSIRFKGPIKVNTYTPGTSKLTLLYIHCVSI